MDRILLRIGGAGNALFVLFHVWLGYRIHSGAGFAVGDRPLLEMLNVGGTLFILFFVWVSLRDTDEVLGTRLGRSVLVFGSLLYGTRAVEEIAVSPRFAPAIFIACALLAGLHLFLFFRSGRKAA